MRSFQPEKPLISLHIPKCAGQSFRRVLEIWFEERLFTHYFQTSNAPPERVAAASGICIHGHFNRNRGFGADQYYPAVDQFITILRDPLEIALSNYFFWKTKARARQIELGIITEGEAHDYQDIDDFFRKRPFSHIPDFMPREISLSNYREIIENHFVWIGTVESLQDSIRELAGLLGFPRIRIPVINSSPRDEILPMNRKRKFVADNPLAFAIYDYAREQRKQERP